MSANDQKDVDTAAGDSTTGGGDADTPAQKLAKLIEALKKAEAENEQLGRQATALKGTIAGLTKEVAELTKVIAESDQRIKAWEKAAKELNEKKGKEEKYYKIKRPMLDAAVSDKDKKFVEGEKQKGKDAVDAIARRVTTLQQNEVTQTQQLAEAEAKAVASQQRYEAQLNLARDNDARLKDLAALHAEAEKEDEQNNVARMFFLILEMSDVLGELDIPSVAEFTRRVNEAQTAAATDAANAAAAKDKLAQTRTDLKNAQKDLSVAKADRRKKILEAIPADAAAATASS